MTSNVPPAIRSKPASTRKPTVRAAHVNDALFHLRNAMRSLELAREQTRGDLRERLRVRFRAVSKEHARLKLLIDRHGLPVRSIGPGR